MNCNQVRDTQLEERCLIDLARLCDSLPHNPNTSVLLDCYLEGRSCARGAVYQSNGTILYMNATQRTYDTT